MNDEVIGPVTSGNFSPTLGKGIAMGFIHPNIEQGSAVLIRGTKSESEAEVTKLPFYRPE